MTGGDVPRLEYSYQAALRHHAGAAHLEVGVVALARRSGDVGAGPADPLTL
ncbi:MAG TPA: hypothetical protein VIY28_02220 [Pseudonocardiaceae bacterium]